MLNGVNEHLVFGELNLKPRETWSFQVVADELGNKSTRAVARLRYQLPCSTDSGRRLTFDREGNFPSRKPCISQPQTHVGL